MNKEENGWVYCLQCDYRFNRTECIIHEYISNNHGCYDGKPKKTKESKCVMDEVEKICREVDKFSSDIKTRMVQKYKDEGYQGWDGDYPFDYLCREIADDAAKIEIHQTTHNKEAIDIGARAMMLWYRYQKSK